MTYKCNEPCPLCGGIVEVYGSDCYPEDGITFECMEETCQYEGFISCNIRTNCLVEAAKNAHDFIYKNKNI